MAEVWKSLTFFVLLGLVCIAGCTGGGGPSASDALVGQDAVGTDGQDRQCTPRCNDKWCGDDDGCGGKCTRCPDHSTCNLDGPVCECPGLWCGYTCCLPGQSCGPKDTCLECTPQCQGKECGSDGCGGSCGACPQGQVCQNGKCAGCQPNCVGKECGNDGCGGSCGNCRADQVCHDGVCETQTHGAIGNSCEQDGDCPDPGSVCYPEVLDGKPTGFIGGYCIVYDCNEGSCPEGSTCVQVVEGGGAACLRACSSAAGCDQGYSCNPNLGVCWPFCMDDSGCPGDSFCDKTQKFCVPVEFGCSPQNPNGYCPGDLVCQGGKCKPYQFDCTDSTYEPNDEFSSAAEVNPGVKQGLQICKGDVDYFKLKIPAGHIGTLGMYFTHELGDLDLCAYLPDGTFLGCRYDYENYPSGWRGYDWNDEYLSALAGPISRTVIFKGFGYDGAVNTYRLDVRLVEWKDGPNCSDYYSPAECAGCDPNTGTCQLGLGKAHLIQFPFADPNDPYVGNGYVLEHSSSYRWLRRETIMLIRYAIHEVQEKFAGTKPLGLLDMCQIDGITPGFDVGNPRHPETTHDQGGNIDVAYYQTGPDNLGKVVCDPQGGSNDGYYCTDVSNHIVDLPRTAYFLAKLAESPRFRVAGVDKMIAPLLLAELEKQRDMGWISKSSYNKLASGALAYGDGWPFHHHHIHVSLKWWSQGLTLKKEPPVGCGFRFPGDGAWPEGVH